VSSSNYLSKAEKALY